MQSKLSQCGNDPHRRCGNVPQVCFVWNVPTTAVRERITLWRDKPKQSNPDWEKLRAALVLANKEEKTPPGPHWAPAASSKDYFPLPNLQVADVFPQLDILASPKLTAFISHGGGNSVSEALERGVPLLLIPHATNADAPLSVDRAVEAGVGLDLAPVLASYPPRARAFAFHCGEGFYTGAASNETYEQAISLLDGKWDDLAEFFQDFILDEKPDKRSGYTLRELKKNVEDKLFGGANSGLGAGRIMSKTNSSGEHTNRTAGDPPLGEQQLTHKELATKMLALVGSGPASYVPPPTSVGDKSLLPAPAEGEPGGRSGSGTTRGVGVVVAIVVAVVGIVVLVVVFGLWFLLRRKPRKKRSREKLEEGGGETLVDDDVESESLVDDDSESSVSEDG